MWVWLGGCIGAARIESLDGGTIDVAGVAHGEWGQKDKVTGDVSLYAAAHVMVKARLYGAATAAKQFEEVGALMEQMLNFNLLSSLNSLCKS